MGKPYYTRRNSLRRPDYDYSQAGAYFVTVCTHQQNHYFGSIQDVVIHRQTWGNIAHEIWLKTPEHFPTVRLDTHIIMPNHMHGIIVLTEDGNVKLGTVMGSYKSAVSKQINAAHNPEKNIIWQRAFYDHIIQHEREYRNIQEYILANPTRWREDRFYTVG